MKARLNPLAALATVVALAGCAAGPNYARPDLARSPAAPGGFAETTAAASLAPPPARWWRLYDDPALSALRRRRWNAYRLRASSQAEKLSKIVRRFVPVVLDREIAVPFEMLGAYGKDAETWVWERRPASGEP